MRWWTAAAMLALAACGQSPSATRSGEKLSAFDVAEPPAPATPAPADPTSATPASAAQIAYSYSYGYALAPARIAAAQARHVALCRALGAARCLVVQTSLHAAADDTVAKTRLLVDARLAARVGERLDAAVAEAGGTTAAREVTAEDVTKQLVDAGAKVRAKQALADRLFALIGTARGGVADLVAAEKAYADVQEELDAARSLDAALRRRVLMSDISIDYTSSAQAGTFGPIARALGDAGESFAGSLAAAITVAIAAIPWVLIGGGAFLGVRALARRRRVRRGADEPAA